MSLFIRKSEYTVRHGQITVSHKGDRYEYQLPSALNIRYNNQKVSVRYCNFDEIYLYDIRNDSPICTLKRKMEIHAAMANQTPEDIKKLNRNAGRMKGNESRIRKRKEEITVEAIAKNPTAFETANRITTPKDDIKTMERNSRSREILYDEYGLNTDNVPSPNTGINGLDKALHPQKEKENPSPFHRGEGSMAKIKIDESLINKRL